MTTGLSPDRGLELAIGRLLTIGTYVSVGLLAGGVLEMLAGGISPLEGNAPRPNPVGIVDDVVHGRPSGLLWLGMVLVVATPAARVAAALVGYVRRRDIRMAGISVAVLCVIGLSVAVAMRTGS